MQHPARPKPPREIFEDIQGLFRPAPDVVDWMFDHIIRPSGKLHNPDHHHLLDASIGVLWTSCANTRQGRVVLGQAEMPAFRCGAWQKGRQEQQMREWFGIIPDFVITLDAYYCDGVDDVSFCALVEHELYHCAQALDEFGVPKFSKDTGLPKFAIKGHDVEEFVGVVRRYGVTSESVADLIIAASKAPEVAKIDIARACGTCMLKAA